MENVNPNEMRRKFLSLDVEKHRIKATHDGNGGFTGYASVFEEEDSYKEATVHGSFEKCLPSFINDGWLAEGHDWSKMGVGYIKAAHEDMYGLFVEFVYHSDAESQAIRTKVNERIEAKKSVKLSIGYYLKAYEYSKDTGVMRLTEIDLKEVSIVNVPALQSASVLNSKSFDELTFEEHGQLASQIVASFHARVKSRIESREGERKAGSELSQQNVVVVDKTLEAIDLLNEVKIPLKELADRNRKGLESEPASDVLESETTKSTAELFAEFHKQQHKYNELKKAA